MRIAMIGQKGIPAVHGGVEKHVHDLAMRLKKEGMDVTVYSRLWYTGKETTEVDGVRTIFTKSIRTKHLDALTHTFTSTIHAMKEHVDVIHYHGVGPSLLAWIPRVFTPKIRVISTFHSIDRKHEKWGLFARTMLKVGEWASCHFPHMTIAVSKTIQQYARDVYDTDAVFIPNAVYIPTKKEETDVLTKHKIQSGNYVLAVSRLIPHKAMHHLIKAWGKRTAGKDKQLVIVGDGYHTNAYVQELHRLAAEDKSIIFTGFQSGNDLYTLFSHASLYVHPSLNEGLPIVVLEAMSYGLPMILSDIPEHEYLLGDKEALYRAGSIKQLTSLLDIILQTEQAVLNKKGQQYKKIIEKEYTWDRVIEEIISVYKKEHTMHNLSPVHVA
ncbi:glycosyltransferase family 4 protein [Patescibacteria group bacterium]|nr:glycosyltransferase family 4 protein [Patescibacteria group bacterium]MBU1721847.1 glycosyltransferase family 4 protein [Patescibacteria group bacterium]MBU1901658.1 glycosyltransferase family 4 protein [Patescibacteria group bacterium]